MHYFLNIPFQKQIILRDSQKRNIDNMKHEQKEGTFININGKHLRH